MKRPLKQTLAILLTLCSLLALLVPAVSADAPTTLEPEMVIDGLIYNDFGISQYYCIGEVNGHDYLFVPVLGTLFVFDLDTWEMVDVQYFESDKTRHSGYMDSKGIVWIYGASAELYRYDPIAKTMMLYSVPMSGYSKLYSPVEVDGKIYFGTYGAASEGGASLVCFDPATLEWETLAKLEPGAMYSSALTYHNGYFYAVAQMNKAKQKPQYIVKFDPVTKMVVDKLDIYNDGTKPYYSNSSYHDDIQVAGDILFVGGNHQTTMLAIDISGDTMKFADDLKNMPAKGGIQRCISEEVDGKIYFVVGDHRDVLRVDPGGLLRQAHGRLGLDDRLLQRRRDFHGVAETLGAGQLVAEAVLEVGDHVVDGVHVLGVGDGLPLGDVEDDVDAGGVDGVARAGEFLVEGGDRVDRRGAGDGEFGGEGARQRQRRSEHAGEDQQPRGQDRPFATEGPPAESKKDLCHCARLLPAIVMPDGPGWALPFAV